MSEEKFWAEASASKEDLGEIISLYRKSTKMSESDFAEKIGCTKQILKSSENGKGAHVYGTFLKMTETFGLVTEISVSSVESIV